MTIRIVFGVLASLGLILALGTVLARNLVHAALCLVGFFFLVACLFVLLEAEFMAAMQVLVYIGAVAILIMFAIMLTRNVQGDEASRSSPLSRAAAGVVSLGLLAVLVVGILADRGAPDRPAWAGNVNRVAAPRLDRPAADARGAAINDMTHAVGTELMTRFAVPFEVAGLLLTAALVGAVALAQGDVEAEPEAPGRLAGARAGGPGPDPALAPASGNGHAEGASTRADALTPTPTGPAR